MAPDSAFTREVDVRLMDLGFKPCRSTARKKGVSMLRGSDQSLCLTAKDVAKQLGIKPDTVRSGTRGERTA